jgi:hypothetical protein
LETSFEFVRCGYIVVNTRQVVHYLFFEVFFLPKPEAVVKTRHRKDPFLFTVQRDQFLPLNNDQQWGRRNQERRSKLRLQKWGGHEQNIVCHVVPLRFLLHIAFGALPAAFGNVSAHHEISFTAECFFQGCTVQGLLVM